MRSEVGDTGWGETDARKVPEPPELSNGGASKKNEFSVLKDSPLACLLRRRVGVAFDIAG